jgi:chaperonin GroEL
VGIIGGGGDKLKLRDHVESLKLAYRNSDDAETRKVLRQRIGTLQGGAITLWVGGSSPREIERNKESAEHGELTLRAALEYGVLPGGGTAYLACKPLLCQGMQKSESLEQRLSYQILHKAMETPLRTMLENVGLEPAQILAQLNKTNEDIGFDIQQNKIVNMLAAGVLDVATVQKTALRYAVKSAALALTVEVVVHKKNPQRVIAP